MDESHIEPPPIVAPPIAPQEPGTVAVALDQDGRLAEDVACRHCGYNLRGLELAGRCPECEMAIEKTLHAFLLRFSDSQWLRHLKLGITLLVIALLTEILAGLVVGIAFMVALVFVVESMAEAGFFTGALIVIGVGALLLLNFTAYWFITTPEPQRARNVPRYSPRRIARQAIVGSLILGVSAIAIDPEMYSFMSEDVIDSPILTATAWTLGIGASILWLLGFVALFIYARSMALRFPDDRLARSTRLVMWGYLLPTACVDIAVLWDEAVAIFGSSVSVGMDTVSTIVQMVFGVAIFVFGIWAIVLLFIYRHRLKQALALAAR